MGLDIIRGDSLVSKLYIMSVAPVAAKGSGSEMSCPYYEVISRGAFGKEYQRPSWWLGYILGGERDVWIIWLNNRAPHSVY